MHVFGLSSPLLEAFTSMNLYLSVLPAVPTEAPTAVTTLPILDPPLFLSANRTEQGVLLQWFPPEAPFSPLTGYVLQARRDQGQWVILSSNISANQSEMLVQGLLRVKICPESFSWFILRYIISQIEVILISNEQ